MVLLLGTALFLVPSLKGSDGMEGQLDRWSILQRSGTLFWAVLPLLVALLAGVICASDQRGLLGLVRTRGTTVRSWLVATTVTGCVLSAAAVVIPIAAAFLVLVTMAPARGTSLQGYLPPGFGDLPVPVGVLGATTLAGVALCLLSISIGLWSASALTAAVVPMVLFLITPAFLPQDFQFLGSLRNMGLDDGPGDVSPATLLLYWGSVAVVALVAMVWWVRRVEHR